MMFYYEYHYTFYCKFDNSMCFAIIILRLSEFFIIHSFSYNLLYIIKITYINLNKIYNNKNSTFYLKILTISILKNN